MWVDDKEKALVRRRSCGISITKSSFYPQKKVEIYKPVFTYFLDIRMGVFGWMLISRYVNNPESYQQAILNECAKLWNANVCSQSLSLSGVSAYDRE
ncbi:CLUMA_CG000707, isoform A [Clunio marinus]|uniref:CLUMA_CG000707, isoform A n=1 Tax=Clunio marinus TaxID=568069 RepID=A0A1J1HH49_9DIPT|nr:CLUMA_CG000707, isoform A [Clunio marinus]